MTGPPPDEPRSIETGLIPYLLFISLLWGGNVVSIKIGARGISPLTMATLRFLIGGGSIYFYALIKGIRLRLDRDELFLHLANGLLFAFQIALFYLGTFRTSAAHAAVLINTNIFFVALLAHFFILRDRLSIQKTFGLLLAFSGVSVLFADRPPGLSGGASPFGNSLILISALILAIKTIYIKRLIERIDPVKVVFWEMAVGVPLLGLFALLFGESLPDSWPSDLIAALLYQGIVVGAFCFVASTLLLKRYHASSVASFSVLVPLFGVLLSSAILGDPLTSHLVAGGGLIAAGIGVVIVRRPFVQVERGS